jgi:hypothetical protein
LSSARSLWGGRLSARLNIQVERHFHWRAWAAGRDKPGRKRAFLRKCAAFTLPVVDEWLLDQPDDNTRSS